MGGMNTQGFNCRRNQGFQMTLSNGYTVSVQFGIHNYCDARDLSINANFDAWRTTADDTHTCANAEVAIIAPNGDFVPFDSGDTVRGHTDPDTVAKIIAWVMALPAKSNT